MNNYLICANDSITLNEHIKNILDKNNEFNNVEINKYDLEINSLSDALEDLNTYGLFSNKKIVEIINFDKITIEDNKKELNELVKYLEKKIEDNLLFIVVNKMDNRKKIYTTLKKLTNYIDNEINVIDIIKKELINYKIDNSSINLLIEYCNNDINKIKNECNKLKNYKYKEKIITIDDIKQVVSKVHVEDSNVTFSLIGELSNKNIKECLKIYKELKLANIDDLSIIGLIASQLRILYQVKELENKSINDISSILDEKAYRIQKTKENLYMFDKKELLNLIIELEEIDYRIKTTTCNSSLLIEEFIMNI